MWRRAASRCAAAAAGGVVSFNFNGDNATARERPQWMQVWDYEAKGFAPLLRGDDKWHTAVLDCKRRECRNTWRYNFRLQSSGAAGGIRPSCCCLVRGYDHEGNEFIRPYSPITTEYQKGTIDFVIRHYPDGKMGTYLEQLQPGSKLEFKGPYMKFPWKPNQYKHIGMIAGGTGITPLYQILVHSMMLEDDATEFSIVYCNDSIDSVPLSQELWIASQWHMPRCHIYHVIKNVGGPLLQGPPSKSTPEKRAVAGSRATGCTVAGQTSGPGPGGGNMRGFCTNWKGGIGIVTKEILKAWMPKPGEGPILVCGPPGMMRHISGELDYSTTPATQGNLTGLLKELGYSEDDVFKF